MLLTHRANAEFSKSPPDLVKSWSFFENLLSQHAIERPPFSISIFSVADVQKCSHFAMEMYFSQLRQFQYIFGEHCQLELNAQYQFTDRVDVSLVINSSIPRDKYPFRLSQAVKSTGVEVFSWDQLTAIAPPAIPSTTSNPSSSQDVLIEVGRISSPNSTPLSGRGVRAPSSSTFIPLVFNDEAQQKELATLLRQEMEMIESEFQQKMQHQQGLFQEKILEMEKLKK